MAPPALPRLPELVPDLTTDLGAGVVTLRWRGRPFLPPRETTTQATGICFTRAGGIVLVTGTLDPPYWTLPGGHPESGESLDQALAREVAEEVCALVVQSEYIGCQEVIPHVGARHFQARFWALVDLLPWDPEHEIAARLEVPASQFLGTFEWGDAPAAGEILRLGLREQETRLQA